MDTLSAINPHSAVGKMQIAAIATDEFNDEQFEQLFWDYQIADTSDFSKIMSAIEINRPVLYNKLQARVNELLAHN